MVSKKSLLPALPPVDEGMVQRIQHAIKKWLEAVRENLGNLSLVASGLEYDLFARVVADMILPTVGAEFIATASRSLSQSKGRVAPQQTELGMLIGWPEGVEGPATVDQLLADYPKVFAGVPAENVLFVVASPEWQRSFQNYMNNTKNLVVGMPDSVFKQMQKSLAKKGVSAGFEQQQIIRQYLSWSAEGGYEGWMRRAERIARTELATARNTAQYQAAIWYQEAGMPVFKTWLAAHDERTRPDHAMADGKTAEVNQPFIVGDDRLMFPGDRENGSPEQVINCRCAVDYVQGEVAREREVTTHHDLERLIKEMTNEMLVADGAETTALKWSGTLAPIGEPTGDGRVFAENGEFRFREFPLPLLWQETTTEGHDQARVVGVIEEGEIADGVISASGVVFSSEKKVIELLHRGVIRPSVDLCDFVADYDDAENPDDAQMIVTGGAVMAATLVAKPAFENVGIQLTGEEVGGSQVDTDGLVASVGTLELTTMPVDVFADPGLEKPTPLTVDAESGRVVGHLALWNTNHVGLGGRQVKPPRSRNGYASFHQSTVYESDGTPVAVGRLTVGGGHADTRAGMRAAAEHYDQTGACWAYVRAGEDAHGIYVVGKVNPDATPEQIRAGASAPLSGDWRRIGSGLELVAALSVSTPGFPIRREYTSSHGSVMSMVASLAPVSESVEPTEFAEAVVKAVDAYLVKRSQDERRERFNNVAQAFRNDPWHKYDARFFDESGA